MMMESTGFIFRKRKLLMVLLPRHVLTNVYRFWNNEFIDDLLTDRTARNLLYVEVCSVAMCIDCDVLWLYVC